MVLNGGARVHNDRRTSAILETTVAFVVPSAIYGRVAYAGSISSILFLIPETIMRTPTSFIRSYKAFLRAFASSTCMITIVLEAARQLPGKQRGGD